VLELALQIVQHVTVAVVQRRFSLTDLSHGVRGARGVHRDRPAVQLAAATALAWGPLMRLETLAMGSARSSGTVTTGQLAWLMQ